MADPLEEPVYPRELVDDELERICASPVLAQSERLKRFLRYAVEMSLRGDAERLKESVIGTEVFDRALGYNPKEDAIVRVEAHRLRQKLDQYYGKEGQQARLRFVLPKGKYSVRVERGPGPQPVQGPEPPPGEGAKPTRVLVPETTARRAVRVWRAVAAIALVGGVAAGAWYASRGQIPETQAIEWRRLTLDNGLATDPVLMPDGKTVIYAADRGMGANLSLWRQSLSGRDPLQLTTEPYDTLRPAVSPDGQWMVYQSRDPRAPGIYRRNIAGGKPQLLVPGGLRPRISPNGRWIAYTLRNEQEWQPGKIGVVAAEGGAPIELASDFADAHFGIFSDDSRYLLFCGTQVSNDPEREHDWWVIEMPDRPGPSAKATKTMAFPRLRQHLARGDSRIPPNEYLEQPADWRDGWVYFSSPLGSATASAIPLWRLKLEPNLTYTGTIAPQRLSFGVNADLRARVGVAHDGPGGAAHRVVTASGTTSIDIWRLPLEPDREGRMLGGLPERVTSHTDFESFPAAAANGQWLAFATDRGERRQMILRNRQTQREEALAAAPYGQDFPVWSPDNKRIAFRQYELPKVPILVADRETKRVERICEDCGAPTSWSPDGQYLLYEPGATIAFVGRYDLAAKKPQVLLRHPEYSLRGARYSPNGRWIAFYAETSREGRRIFVAPADRETPPSEWIPVTRDQDLAMLPAWSEDSRQIFYLDDAAGQRSISGQRVSPETGRPVGPSFTVQRFQSPRRSLLRLTRARVSAVGLSVQGREIFVAMDEQLAEIFWADVPAGH